MKMMKNMYMTLTLAMVFCLASCSDEDMPQAQQSVGSLHIASVSIDGEQVGGSRVVFDGGVTVPVTDATENSFNRYNRSITGFSEGDKMELIPCFTENNDNSVNFTKATYNGKIWVLDNPTFDKLRPGENQVWEDARLEAHISILPIERTEISNVRSSLGIVQGDVPEYKEVQEGDATIKHNSYIFGDMIAASSDSDDQIEEGYGPITIDKDLLSPTLGASTIVMKHFERALLRLPMSEVEVVADDYIVDGTAIHVNFLGTLWAVMKGYQAYYYCPLTQVTIGGVDYLQAIVHTGYDLVGFKAVLLTDKSGTPGTEGEVFDNDKTLTLDLPFKTGENTGYSEPFDLVANHCYNLALNISPSKQAVTLAFPGGKPGWSVTESNDPAVKNENVLDNSDNEFELKYIAGENGAAGTFEVKTAKGLQALNKWMMSAGMSDADFTALVSGAPESFGSISKLAYNIKLVADITLPVVSGQSNWIPIGTEHNCYYGIFDGNGKTIKNLTIVDGSNKNVGLIGKMIGNGTVKDLTLEDVQITCTTSGSYVGGIVGLIGSVGTSKGLIEVSNCTVSGNIQGAHNVGGILGCVNPDGGDIRINKCNNEATINGEKAGGIVGEIGRNANSVEVNGCNNKAEISGYEYVGGIVGYGKQGSIIGCTNTETVEVSTQNTTKGHVGGIAGAIQNVTITGCTNEGVVNGNGKVYLGGIVGYYESKVMLEGCTNTSSATLTVNSSSSSYVGGIVGCFYGNYMIISVKGCMNHANINFTCNNNTSNYVAGIVAYVDDMYESDDYDYGIIACGNTGTITGNLSSGLAVGGISASPNNCKFYGCWTKDVVEYGNGTGQKDGFGNAVSGKQKNECHIFTQSSNITDEILTSMNGTIKNYNRQWVLDTIGGWPVLSVIQNATE